MDLGTGVGWVGTGMAQGTGLVVVREKSTASAAIVLFRASTVEALPTLLGRDNPSPLGSWEEARVWGAPLGIKHPDAQMPQSQASH